MQFLQSAISLAQETQSKHRKAQEIIKHNNRDRRSAIDNDDYVDCAMRMPNIQLVAGMHQTMSLLSSEFHKVSHRHVIYFMVAVLISMYGSSFL